ncbi:MAG: hydroxymethylglutaryl-CoA lyase [Candidatus Dormibacteria bacterium]
MTNIRFTEVGPRDGFQNWPEPVGTETKVTLVRAALAAGADRVEAASMVSPRWVPQMADGEEVLGALTAQEMTRVRVLVPNLKGLERAIGAGARNVLVNVGATNGFNHKNLNRTIAETLDDIQQVMDATEDEDIRVDASVSVAWGCPYDGPVSVDQAIEVAMRLVEMGVDEVSFGDTIGVATPTAVGTLATYALDRLGSVDISMHFHDTRGLAVANVFSALESGIELFEGSIGGIGGCPFAPRSTGNVCSEDLLYMVQEAGYDIRADVWAMVEAARALAAELGKGLPGKLYRGGPPPWLEHQLVSSGRLSA